MPKVDFSKVDINTINPEKLDMGTCAQDCNLIAQTYERGAHSTLTETAVFATFSRALENTRSFSVLAQETLAGYIREPVETAGQVGQQAEGLVGSAGVSRTQNSFQGVKLGDFDISTLGNAFGDSFMNWMKDCIPCNTRIIALLELKPHVDLLGALEDDLKSRLATLSNLGKLLSNLDIYGDFCSLLQALNFMCVPDLQRIVALLSALLASEALELDSMIGFLQSLIAPIFAPILLNITSLLDQFSLLVVSPMDCIIDSINEQLQKLRFQAKVSTNNSETDFSVEPPVLQPITSGLEELATGLSEGKAYIQSKLQFYIEQINAMFGEMGAGDVSYLKASMKKLTLVRLIGFVSAIIQSIAKGQSVCSGDKPPEKSELDNFFDNFLSPNLGIQVIVDENGDLTVQEKDNNFEQIVNSPTNTESTGNVKVLTIDGEDIVNTDMLEQIQLTQQVLTQPVKTKIKCKLETTKDNADLVNKWVSELNSK